MFRFDEAKRSLHQVEVCLIMRERLDMTNALAPVLASSDAEALKDLLSASRGADLILDASATRRVGALCAQILYSAARTWRQDGRIFACAGLTEEAQSSIRILGLNPEELDQREGVDDQARINN
jgi:chemotaxis protein CheX